jgi:hypothetical protein
LAPSIRDVTEDAPRPAINVQRTCGKRPDHTPKQVARLLVADAPS